MNRRDYIVSIGSAVTAGLSGCMDLVSSDSEDPKDGQNDKSSSNDQDGVNIGFFTTSTNCASGPEDEMRFISSQENDKKTYDFNGQVIVPTSCHDAVASVDLNNNTLRVDINIVEPTEKCDQDCTGLVSFAGSVKVDDSLTDKIENTEIII